MPQFLTTDEIRQRWISFFAAQGHKHIASDSLVPQNDPSVLFTGAGMNQFKDHFMGRARIEHPWQRAVTVQKCVRTGDIDNVGRTPNHHTFFEMLGNFSFGDYFKQDAVQWAWRFLTDAQAGLGLEKDRLSVTIFGGDAKLGIAKDGEAEAFWKQYAPELRNANGSWRIYEYGEHDNFWPADAPSLGPNGPCGPCSEIYYDTKPEQGAPEPVANSKDSTRYVEIWNLVFTQFNRLGAGKLEPLSQKNIDTGAGLERVARVVQKKTTNFDIDLLAPVVQEAARLANKKYGQNADDDRRMRRITDHTRAAVFMIADGVAPKNEGRNYVVRRLMRRAILDGRELGIDTAFLSKIAQVVIQQMSAGYPELLPRAQTLIRLIEEEETAFSRTLIKGEERLNQKLRSIVWLFIAKNPTSALVRRFPYTAQQINRGYLEIYHKGNHISTGLVPGLIDSKAVALQKWVLDDGPGNIKVVLTEVLMANAPREHAIKLRDIDSEWQANRRSLRSQNINLELDGELAFDLWQTDGFPFELTAEIAAEYGISVDKKGYNAAYEEAIKRSQAGSTMAKEIFAGGPVSELKKRFAGQATKFEGYTQHESGGAKVLAIVQGEQLVETASAGEALVLLDRTPFYGESGGQAGDTGTLSAGSDVFEVVDTQKTEGLILHRVKEAGAELRVGAAVKAAVSARRLATMRNHSATHLLHRVLREVLGTHVEQRGSLVGPERLRFDFTHFEQIAPAQLAAIEAKVNELVCADFAVSTNETGIAEAKAAGAMALFGEKYGERVRVVKMGPSVELCGGTHCQTTGQIGYFRLVSESSIAAGVRRIEAFTGAGAVSDARKTDESLSLLAQQLKTRKDTLHERLKQLQDERAALERELEGLRKKAANAAAGDLLGQAKDVAGTKLLAANVEGADAAALRTTLDGIRKTFKDGAVVLGGAKDGKVALLVSLSADLVKRGGHAGNVLKELAPKVGGKGGGKPDMAQGGGTDTAKLPEAIAAAEALLSGMLK